MGGCCCSSRKTHLHGTPVYYYCPPPSLEERESLRSHNGVSSSGLTEGLLIQLNLDTSTPDTYQAPPAPLPYDAVFGFRESTDSMEEEEEETLSCSSFKTSADLEVPDLKAHLKNVPTKVLEVSKKPIELDAESKEEDEDVCPICLEDYDLENPKYVIICEHYFHLSCILEWMERSDACPICDKEMLFDQNSK